MSDRAGQAHALTVLTPIRPGHEQRLRRYLEALPVGSDGPLGKIPATHFGRWVIIPQLVYEGPPQRRDELRHPYLLFSSSFDGYLDPYLDDLLVTLRSEADAIWGHCLGWPGAADVGRAKDYLWRNRVPTSLFYAAYPQATTGQVLRALERRRTLTELALRTQGRDPGALKEAYLAAFPEPLRDGGA